MISRYTLKMPRLIAERHERLTCSLSQWERAGVRGRSLSVKLEQAIQANLRGLGFK